MAVSCSFIHGADRRKHWRDRRSGAERRCSSRKQHESFDCRSGTPRRQSDIAGELYDGEVWWKRPVRPIM